MPYLGNSPSSGGYHKLDSLTASATATYALTLGGSAYYPATANQLLVSLNGVIQAPQDSFTISGSNIVFASALSSSDSIDFIMSFGDVYNVGTPADGTITNAKIQSMAASKLTGALPAIDGSNLTGISSNAGSEYFEVNLTTDQASLTDSSNVVVDFGGSGTVVYDTASYFDSANDAYLLDSSNGVYIISFSCGVSSNAPETEQLIYAHAGIEVATDGTTYSAYKAGGSQLRNNDTDSGGSLTLTGSFIYKATTATTKIRLKAFADNAGTSTWRIGSTAANIVQVTGSSDLANARVTWMSVMRIA